MKKKSILLIGILIIASIVYIISTKSKQNSYPSPNLVPFEKQEILSRYNWSMITINGKTFNFLTKKDRVIFLYNMSLKDENAKSQLSDLNDLYEKYKTKVDFYFITNDKQKEVRDFLENNDFYFPVVYSLGNVPAPINLDKTPKAYVISKNGRIVLMQEGNANWNSKVVTALLEGLTK